MAIVPSSEKPDCFADSKILNPLNDVCAACSVQDQCEQTIVDRLEDEEEAEAKEAQMFQFKPRPRAFDQAVRGFSPAKREAYVEDDLDDEEEDVERYDRTPPPPPAPPAHPSQFACQGVAPIDAVPRSSGEEIWARLAKNVMLGSLARGLTEASLVAEDERRRPVGQWGRTDRPRRKK